MIEGLFRIEYEYYDKRGHIRSKKIECGSFDRVVFHCKEIEKLEEHKPISTPRITKVNYGKPDDELKYRAVLRGEYSGKFERSRRS